jgi:hypothetical protein
VLSAIGMELGKRMPTPTYLILSELHKVINAQFPCCVIL